MIREKLIQLLTAGESADLRDLIHSVRCENCQYVVSYRHRDTPYEWECDKEYCPSQGRLVEADFFCAYFEERS